MAPKPKDSAEAFEQALKNRRQANFVLRLFVTGATSRSVQAIANIKQICETHLKGRYDLEVVDIYQKPDLLKEDQVVALPTLIKKLPAPLRRIVGDLSDTDRVLAGLDLVQKGK